MTAGAGPVMTDLAGLGPDDDPFLTIREVAAAARASVKTVYRAVHCGELESVRIGTRCFRVRRSAVAAWLNGPQVTLASPAAGNGQPVPGSAPPAAQPPARSQGGTRLMTPAQVAAVFGVSPKTVNTWARTGKITPVLTPGGHRRYWDNEVRAVLTGQPRPAPAPDGRQPPASGTSQEGRHAEKASWTESSCSDASGNCVQVAAQGEGRGVRPVRPAAMTISFRSREPSCKQLARILREQISNGTWQRDGQLPSVRQLAGDYSLSAGTVVRALELLASERVVIRILHRGTYITRPGTPQADGRPATEAASATAAAQTGRFPASPPADGTPSPDGARRGESDHPGRS
jgi:excisionase family DNA binding protein